MGLFTKMIEKKKQYDEEIRQQRLQEERERENRRQAEIQEELDAVRRLETGELMQGIIEVIRSSAWITKSRGNSDTNKRQIIITPVAILANNHDKDVFFRCLEDIEQDGKDGVRYYLHREVIKGIREIHDEWFSYERDSEETKRNDALLKYYRESDSYMLEICLYEELGYSHLNGALLLKRFAKALKAAMEKSYLTLHFSDIEENDYGFYKFEMMIRQNKGKELF